MPYSNFLRTEQELEGKLLLAMAFHLSVQAVLASLAMYDNYSK
jgi:hypothetical protein